ncbi:MAG: hypothetical protein HOH13_08245 [Crocinitomicaceae bacterium]|jgi:hypothetical protein|nr:hypothetical protein [Crocinitomicaceae bacterium]MBT6030281.1 hypothetical protein [Crocinitomicaceae bacterium]MBT6515444.1 hypothetical protein [Crocinitomicaceae bacterium]
MIRVLYFFLFSLCATVTYAQEIDSAGTTETKFKLNVVPTISAGMHVNFQDFYLDFGAGAYDQKSRIGAQLSCSFRPFYKKVQIHQQSNIIRQWKEKKYLVSLDLYKRLLKFHLSNTLNSSFLTGAKSGYLFGDYLGTRERPKAGLTINPFVGFSIWLNGINLDVTYLFFNDRLASVPNSRLMFSLNIPITP